MQRQAHTEDALSEQLNIVQKHNSRKNKSKSKPSYLARLSLLSIAAAATVLGLVASPAAGQQDSISIELLVNNDDADSSPGPVLAPGSAIEWTYVVSVNGSTKLYDFIVTDTSGTNPDCDIDGDGTPDGFNLHPGPLTAGDSFICKTTGAAAGSASVPYQTTGAVKAVDSTATQVFEASDPAYYSSFAPFSPEPAVSIEAAINGTDADTSPGPAIPEGQPAEWKFVVTNTGNVALADMTVTDDVGVDANCGDGTNVISGPVAPGASITCTGVTDLLAFATGETIGVSTVVATPIDPTTGQELTKIADHESTSFSMLQAPEELAFTGTSTTLAAALALAMVISGLVLLHLSTGRKPLAVAAAYHSD